MKILTGVLTAVAMMATISIAQAQTNDTAANADMVVCSEAGIDKANVSVAAITDATKKEEATKEMGMAKDLMMQSDPAGCKMHMDNAMSMVD